MPPYRDMFDYNARAFENLNIVNAHKAEQDSLVNAFVAQCRVAIDELAAYAGRSPDSAALAVRLANDILSAPSRS